ncbi:MAG: hypothetical protein ACTHMS_03260 [Jatrophihabitans sp.]|uniref:hypothetical protein n=1 Tax=Jatrophihabitans sp. TaxID=1932789 RepID=UPI003F7F5CAF
MTSTPHPLIATPTTPAAAAAPVGPGPTAPPGTQQYADEILSWIKWGALTVLTMATIASVGMLVWGRATHHPRGARLGFDGIMISIVGAVLYTVAPSVIASIAR